MPETSHNLLSDLDLDVNFFDSLNNDDLYLPSKYYSKHNFNQLVQDRNLTLSIVHLNVRSFGANFDKFQALFSSCNLVPDIPILYETWYIHDSPRELTGYLGPNVTRPNGRGGGLSIFVRETINSYICSEIYNSISIETVSITVRYSNSYLVILGCYKPHSGTNEEFVTDLTRSFNNHSLMNKKNILFGDLNVNLLNSSSERENLMNFMQSYFFVPKITEPTRFSSNMSGAPSLLDQIWTNFRDNFIQGILSIGITDHRPRFSLLTIDNKKVTSDKNKITFRHECHIRFKLVQYNSTRSLNQR